MEKTTLNYKEVKQDLFLTDNSYALAHCISTDCRMGAGIAKIFVKRYPNMREALQKMQPRIGDALPYLAPDGRLVFNLITKDKYWNKPTYETFTETIQSLKVEVEKANVQKLAIPLLGAGLDRLSWSINRDIIKDVFKDTHIDILVCKL